MVLLRNSQHASSIKMSSAMALAASRRTTSATTNNGLRSKNTDYPIKRRSMTAVSTVLIPRKRPRTSWGKPRSNPAVLHCSPLFIKEEAAASSTSANDEDYFGSTVSSNCATVPSLCRATSFVQAEPLQHLAIKLEGESYDDGPLHQVPATLFPAEHLLSAAMSSLPLEFNQLSRCADSNFPPISSITWPASPHSSSSPLCSSATDEFSGDDMLNWDQDFHEGSCDFLSERFYEIEKNMSTILDEALRLASESSQPLSQQQEASTESECIHERSSVVTVLVSKAEEGSESSQLSEMSCTTANLQASADTATTAGDCEEEYRIDLVDFEPEPGDGEEGPKLFGGAPAASCQKLALALNYEEVIRAWSEKGSFLADGSWGCILPDGFALDLTAWEPENQDLQALHDFCLGASKMITVAVPDDVNGVGEHGIGGVSMARHARVLRYREKRQTRLFSKKIRYEVRKLNAERRPRMKGRFIKRSLDQRLH